MFRILVVDDNQDAAESLAMALELEGYQTEVAHDGADALRKSSRFHPQVVILDISMPIMDGFEAAQALRRHVPHVRLVVLSGTNLADMREQVDKVHFDAMFVKPADPAELLATVGYLVRER
ncbi:MAG TPA: response regulator [Ideonella sp.]|nr:response regulator [Ideonella sp.]